jgi:hypothetical protein
VTRYMHPLEQVIRRRPAHICDRCDYVDDPAENRPCYCTARAIARIRDAAAAEHPERSTA